MNIESTTLFPIFADQLSESLASLQHIKKNKDVVVMFEVMAEATSVKHHKKKIAFLFSAMRHFAQELSTKGFIVDYVKLDDMENTGSFRTEIERAIKKHHAHKVRLTEPSEYRVLEEVKNWKNALDTNVVIEEDDRFLCSHHEFKAWAGKQKTLRMEFFYRNMRKKYHLLLDHNQPVGGKWNYDSNNRKPPAKGLQVPPTYHQQPDDISKEVIVLVNKHFADHFGDAEPFFFAINRKQALEALDLFIEQRLHLFGDYQDAMIENEPWMYHSHISFYINCGLLQPLECAQKAEQAFYEGKAPLNAVEGFIRQIIGWREFVRGIYWLKMPSYSEANFLEATQPLPGFYWDAKTNMNCLKQCVRETKENAYAHHIQRLMVLGNFALIAGVKPSEINEWFLAVYADAFEWVEMPNVSGMVLFADGGYLASKPYAASGSYINKMSNYCKNCTYNVKEKNGESACPFNYLYWDFLARNQNKLQGNHRLRMIYSTYQKMSDDKKQAIKHDAKAFLAKL